MTIFEAWEWLQIACIALKWPALAALETVRALVLAAGWVLRAWGSL